jgi:hypothetical protein
MSNPFDYIKQDRENRARQEVLQEEVQRRKEKDEFEYYKKAIVETIRQYEKMVTTLLKTLQDAAYPSARVKNGLDIYSVSNFRYIDEIPDPYWYIGSETEVQEEYGSSTIYYVHFIVALEIRNSKPQKFVCWRSRKSNGQRVGNSYQIEEIIKGRHYGKKYNSPLSETQLLETLKKLHPIGR